MTGNALRPFCLASVVLFSAAFGVVSTQPVRAQTEFSDQDKAIHYSLYYEDFKNENFQSALPNLKWIIENAPEYPRNNDRNFERLIALYVGLSAASDGSSRKTYLDSALVWFDKAVEMMQTNGIEFDEVEWKINKGRFLQEHVQTLGNEAPSPASIYAEAYTMAGCEIDPYYVRIIIDDAARSDRKNEAVALLDEAEACYPDNADVMAFIAEFRNVLFTSPEERLDFLRNRLEQHPDDLTIISELFDIYLELEYRDEAAELGPRLLEMEPSALTYRRLGELHLQDGDTDQAIEYYLQALDMPDISDRVRRDVLYNLGVAKQHEEALAEARSYFRQALQVDPDYGQALLAIGDLYATAVSGCSTFEREDQAVYWLVVDYYQRARSRDPNLSAQANQKIAAYRRSFPNQEALFFKGWEPGQAYQIDYGCYTWINESTTVRQP